MQMPDLLLTVYDYFDKKRTVGQERRGSGNSNAHSQLDVLSNLGLESRHLAKPTTQNHQMTKLISHESACADKEVIKPSVERKVQGFLENEIDRCIEVKWNSERLKTRHESF